MYTSAMLSHLGDSNYNVLYYSDLAALEPGKAKVPYVTNFPREVEKWAIKTDNIITV